MNHVVSYSGGKDSTAMLLRMIELDMQIDRIVFADTGKEYPEMYSYLKKVEEFIGRKIEFVKPKMSFDDWFYRIKQKGKHKGMIYGFPKSCGVSWCTKVLKIDPINQLNQIGDTVYLGIAIDEKHRVQGKKTNRVEKYPLIEWGWTEQDCKNYLKKKGLLNPLYDKFDRLGCWCCPKQKKSALKVLWKEYPKLWKRMQQYERDSPHPMRTDLKLKGFERLFEIEEQQHKLKNLNQ